MISLVSIVTTKLRLFSHKVALKSAAIRPSSSHKLLARFLSLILQGSPWSLDILNSEDHNNNILSFVNAFIIIHNILPETLCEKCQCVTGPGLVCEQGVDQDECTCLSQRTEVEVRHSQPLHLCIQHVQYHVADRHCYNNNFIHFYILSSIPLCLFSPLLLHHQISVGQSCQLLQYLRLT